MSNTRTIKITHDAKTRSIATKFGQDLQVVSGIDDAQYVIVRQGDDLVIHFNDGTTVTLVKFYANDISLNMDGRTIPSTLTEAVDGIALENDVIVVDYSGDYNSLEAMLESKGIDASWPNMIDFGFGQISTDLAVGLAAVPLMANVGSAGATSAGATIASWSVNGAIFAGPVAPDHDLLVNIYDADGNLLNDADISVAADGTFSFSNATSYTGPVLLVAYSAGDNPDYHDEATNMPINLENAIAAVVEVAEGDAVTINLTPLSTMAVAELGVNLAAYGPNATDIDVPPNTISGATVMAAIEKIASAFGMTAEEFFGEVLPVFEFDEDGIAIRVEGNNYGRVLAVLSGLDLVDGKTLSQGLSDLLAQIDTNGQLTEAGQGLVLEGAAAAESETRITVKQIALMLDADVETQAASFVAAMNEGPLVEAMDLLSPIVMPYLTDEQIARLDVDALKMFEG